MKPKHSKERLEAFSDAVFAFAATLIVVSFEVPDEFKALKDLMFDFVSFGASFLALILIWKVHYDYYRKIETIDNMIIFINMLLLFVLLFYVYPMKFLANTLVNKTSLTSINDLGPLFTIYSFGFACLFLLVSILYRYSSTKENYPLLNFLGKSFYILCYSSDNFNYFGSIKSRFMVRSSRMYIYSVRAAMLLARQKIWR